MIVGNFLTLLEITLFFETDMHHLVIAALNDSYTLFEPGELPTTGDAAALITKTVAGAFRIGIQLSAPFIVFGLLFNIGLGILARLMPQIQVFFVGLPLSILIGLLFLLLLLGAMMSFFLEYAGGVLQLREQASEAGHRRIRDNCGLTNSVVDTMRCCTMLPAKAATHRTRSGTPKAAATSKASVTSSARRAAPSAAAAA